MGIKKKKLGPLPTFPERWQNLATNIDRLNEARTEYREKHPKVSLVEAHRIVRDFHNKHKR